MIEITAESLRSIWPGCPETVINAFVRKQGVLDKHGVNHSRQRLLYALVNFGHETGNFTIRDLTESGNYSAERICQVWPSRFPTVDAAQPYAHNAVKLFDSTYGGRMGNRSGTHDGSDYCGRGAPQVTGRDGYVNVARVSGVPIDTTPKLAASHDFQPEIGAGFVGWKNLNAKADLGDFDGYVRIWNGGRIGMADRERRLSLDQSIVARLREVDRLGPEAKALPGGPSDPAPAIKEATKGASKIGAGGAMTSGAGAGASVNRTVNPDVKPIFSPMVEWAVIGIGVGVVLIAAALYAKNRAIVLKNWF